MLIYLPIAEMTVNVFTLLALGGATGVLSGLFGVGGGFLMTPLLIFLGIPPSVAVATSANQIIAASVSGFLTHWRRGNVDFRMGNMLLAGGVAGSALGILLFNALQNVGQIDLVISLLYIVFLGTIGGLMAYESLRHLLLTHRRQSPPRPLHHHNALQRMPWRMRFPRSRLYISALLPLGLGLGIGVLVSIMGLGGGFFMVPAMLYLLRMPTSVVIGTSLYQIIFVTANATILHAVFTQTVDLVLALLLLTGSVIGAQLGTRLGAKLPAQYFRGLLTALVLGVAIKLAIGLFLTPANLYSVDLELPE
jgi:uncharacterized membrane protein YfcA